MDEEFISRAIRDLSALIDKPPLTEKLMSRPPFKYLFDIARSVSAATGFPSADLFERDDLSEREDRIVFMDALVGQIDGKLGMHIDINVKAVLAGKEVPNTLRMLSLLAQAATMHSGGEPLPLHPASEPPADASAASAAEEAARRQAEEVEQRRAAEEDARRQEQRQQDAEELASREAREAEQRRQDQEAQEAQEQRRLTDAARQAAGGRTPAAEVAAPGPAPERPVFRRPPPSARAKRQVAADPATVAKPASNIRIIQDDESSDSAPEAAAEGPQWMGAAAELFSGAPEQAATDGALMNDILATANDYNQALGGQSAPTAPSAARQGTVDKNSTTGRLMGHINETVKAILPFAKAVSFLDEHLIRMRTELLDAVDEVSRLSGAVSRNEEIIRKNASATDAKIRTLEEQIAVCKQGSMDLLAQTFV